MLKKIKLWIKSHKKEFNTFMENEVQEIRKLKNLKEWFYCKTSQNAED